MKANEYYTKDMIKEMLLTNDKALVKGLLRIYEYQTKIEQQTESTRENNNIGFNGVDAKILTSFVHFYQKSGFLSKKQMLIARKNIIKYAGQLAKYANEHLDIENLRLLKMKTI